MGKMNQTKEFYRTLAHLFYAVAMADNSFIKNEKLKIIELVESHFNTKIEGEDSKEIIYETLKELNTNKKDSDDAFTIFETFFKANSNLFSEDLKASLLNMVYDVANAHSKRSKGELIILGRLHNLLNITSK